MSEDKKKSKQQRYIEEKVMKVTLNCVYNTESDIIAKLQSVPKKATYIKALISADIAREKGSN